jgi:hypothetical protein
MTRKTSFLRIVPTACGQAADMKPRARLSSRSKPGDSAQPRFSSRPMLGAILPLHDVRYQFKSDIGTSPISRARMKPRGSMTGADLFFTDEQEFNQPELAIVARSSSHPLWWSQTGSNRRPPACKAGALPTELWPLQTTEDRRRRTE